MSKRNDGRVEGTKERSRKYGGTWNLAAVPLVENQASMIQCSNTVTEEGIGNDSDNSTEERLEFHQCDTTTWMSCPRSRNFNLFLLSEPPTSHHTRPKESETETNS